MACAQQLSRNRGPQTLFNATNRPVRQIRQIASKAQLKCLIFDCDGVILESEDIHRRAYNAAFQHFEVYCGEKPVIWSEEFYDILQNTVGGGKPKMRWYFGREGWPTSTLFRSGPQSDSEQATLIDTLQDWKSRAYRDLIGSGEVPPRPGVLCLMDEARAAGLRIAVCSAATKESVVFTLRSLLGVERFEALDCFLAGDDVPRKKPDPLIYVTAAERLGVQPAECLVLEDSTIGVDAALAAGMRCIVTHTPSTASQPFAGAERVLPGLGEPSAISIAELLAPAAV